MTADGQHRPEKTYRIIRFRQDDENSVIDTGLTYDEARAHCDLPTTHGPGWFDGYEQED